MFEEKLGFDDPWLARAADLHHDAVRATSREIEVIAVGDGPGDKHRLKRALATGMIDLRNARTDSCVADPLVGLFIEERNY